MQDFSDEITERGNHYRGSILNECINLERIIDKYLATYLGHTKEKAEEIQSLILDRLTLEAKRTALKAILDKIAIANGFKKSKNNKYPHNELIEDIRRVSLERNYFAHYMINILDSGYSRYPKEIGFFEFRDSAKIIWYSEEKYNELFAKIQVCTISVYDHLKKLRSST